MTSFDNVKFMIFDSVFLLIGLILFVRKANRM